MEDADHFLSLERWQLGVDGTGPESGSVQGPTDDLGLSSSGGDHMMGFMSPNTVTLGCSPSVLPLDNLHAALPPGPDRPSQDWAYTASNWCGFGSGMSAGIHCGISAPAPMSSYNLLPSKVILPPPSQAMPIYQPPQLPHHRPSQAGRQTMNGKSGGLHQKGIGLVATEATKRYGVAGRTGKRAGQPSAKAAQMSLVGDDDKDPAYNPDHPLESQKARRRGSLRVPQPVEDASDALISGQTGHTIAFPPILAPPPPMEATRAPPQPLSMRRSVRQAATDNKFCPGPEDGKGKSARNARTKSSNYRGVTKHRRSGRYEAHLWIRELHRQVYLGGYEHEEHAAEAYDVAALKSKGMNVKTNFDISRYSDLTACMHSISLEELIMAVRRQSQGFSRGSSTFRGVTHHPSGRWEARIGIPGSKHIYLGLHDDEDSAARAYDSALVRLRGTVAATNFSLSDYRNELSDYHRKQQEILEKGQDPAICSGDAFEDWIKNGYRDNGSDLIESTQAQTVATRKQPRRSTRNANRLTEDGDANGLDWQDPGTAARDAEPLQADISMPQQVAACTLGEAL